MKPPTAAPATPSRHVITKPPKSQPPGSFPGIMNFAKAPAMRPNAAHAIKLTTISIVVTPRLNSPSALQHQIDREVHPLEPLAAVVARSIGEPSIDFATGMPERH